MDERSREKKRNPCQRWNCPNPFPEDNYEVESEERRDRKVMSSKRNESIEVAAIRYRNNYPIRNRRCTI